MKGGNILRKNLGATLIGAIIFLVIVGFLGVAVSYIFTTHTASTTDILSSTRAFFVAEGGLERGIKRYKNGCYSAMLLTSTDLTTWTTQPAGTSNDLNGITYSNGLFVAVGDGGTILTSTDTVTWTPRVSGTTNRLNSVAYGGTYFFAVGDNETVLRSTDGITWAAPPSSPNPTGSINFLGVAYQSTGTVFIIAGSNGTICRTTNNGSSWTYPSSGTTNNINSVAYGGTYFFAVGNNEYARRSTDGITWAAPPSSPNPTGSINFLGVAYQSTGTVFIIAGSNGTICRTTNNGSSWTYPSSGTTNQLNGVAYGAAFVAVGSGGTILTSADGTTWTSRTSGTTMQLNGAAYGGGTSIALGNVTTITVNVDESNLPLGSGTFTVQGFTTDFSGAALTNNQMRIRCTATVGNAGRTVEQMANCLTQDVASYGIVGQNTVSKSGNSTVDCGSGASPRYCTQTDIDAGTCPCSTQYMVQLQPIALPSPLPAQPPGGCSYTGNQTVTWPSGTYYCSTGLDLNNHVTINLAGPVTLYATGVSLSNHCSVNNSGSAANLMILSLGDVLIQNNENFKGAIYAPGVTVTVDNNADVTGNIVGGIPGQPGSVSITNSASIVYEGTAGGNTTNYNVYYDTTVYWSEVR